VASNNISVSSGQAWHRRRLLHRTSENCVDAYCSRLLVGR